MIDERTEWFCGAGITDNRWVTYSPLLSKWRVMAFQTGNTDVQFDGHPIQATTTVSTGPQIPMDKYFFNSSS